MRLARILGAVVFLGALPLAAFAQTSGSAPDVSALLAEISQLQQQIAALTGSSTSPTASAPATANAGNACPALTRTLSLGSSGSDVSSLQQFLKVSPATGYFGSLTQTAVEQWQQAYGVVSAGTGATTGFGVVGPKTRAAMENACATGAAPEVTECLPTIPPQQQCPTGWQPIQNADGCTTYYQCVFGLPTASSSVPTAASSSVSATPASCPVVVQPSCSGSVVPFQTSASGCVESYECVL